MEEFLGSENLSRALVAAALLRLRGAQERLTLEPRPTLMPDANLVNLQVVFGEWRAVCCAGSFLI